MRHSLFTTAGLALALVVAACGDSGDDTADGDDAVADGGSDAAAVDATITIDEFAFLDSPEVAVGETISIVNIDGAPHTWTSSDDVFDSGTIEADGGSFETSIDAPGTYSFFCSIHPAMTGTITVVE